MTLHTLDQISQLGLKLLISLGLSFVMFLAGREIIRIWRESAVVLAPFEYLKDGVVIPESGKTFAQLIDHDLRRLQMLFADDGTSGSWLPTADLTGQPQKVGFPTLSSPIFNEIEIQAYGIQVSTLLRSLSRWLRASHQISGRVSERTNEIAVFMQYSKSDTNPGGMVWNVGYLQGADAASFSSACRLYRFIVAQRAKLADEISDEDFEKLALALLSYRRYREIARDPSRKDEAAKLLTENVEKRVDALLNRTAPFPPALKLSAFILQAKADIPSAVSALEAYVAALKKRGLKDKQADELLASLHQSLAPSGRTTVAAASATVSGKPGMSIAIGKLRRRLGCLAIDVDQRIHLITVALPPDAGSAIEGLTIGDERVPLTEKLDSTEDSILIAAPVLASVQATLGSNLEPLSIAPLSSVSEGQELFLVRGQERVRGKVVNRNVMVRLGDQYIPNLIRVDLPPQPGDSGAPLFTADEKIVGLLYAGAQETSYVVPLESFLAERTLSPVTTSATPAQQ